MYVNRWQSADYACYFLPSHKDYGCYGYGNRQNVATVGDLCLICLFV